MHAYRANMLENTEASLASLNILYDEMPKTTGCDKCPSINKDCAFWCCLIINPSMYYIEFLNVWQVVQKWNKHKRLKCILRAIKNYLSSRDSKGCIFYDGGCLVYDHRPLTCRLYGIMSPDSWEHKTKELRKIAESCEVSDNFIKKMKQCDLVHTESGDKYISYDLEKKWFKHVENCERRIGIPEEVIKAHDSHKGSYRTFHDHIMLTVIPSNMLNKLTVIKSSLPSEDDIDKFIDILEIELGGT